MTPCYWCGVDRGGRRWIVGDRSLCDGCAEQVRSVMALAASLQISIYDLTVAVCDV